MKKYIHEFIVRMEDNKAGKKVIIYSLLFHILVHTTYIFALLPGCESFSFL